MPITEISRRIADEIYKEKKIRYELYQIIKKYHFFVFLFFNKFIIDFLMNLDAWDVKRFGRAGGIMLFQKWNDFYFIL